MKIPGISFMFCMIAAFCLCTKSYASEEAPAAGKIDLALLYVGHPRSARENDFVTFLDEPFKEVKTADLASFAGDQAAGFDIIILDYDGDGSKAPRPVLPADYARATVTVGVVGSSICGGLRLKTGYL